MTGHIDSHRIFVYGTLRKDSGHDMYRVLARSSIFVGDATVNGDLYNLDTYPGLVLSSDAHSIVYGEVYELKPELAARVLAILDDYEGCGASDPIPHEYRRKLVRVRFLSGEATEAWAYLLNRDPTGLERIPGGNYLAWRSKRGKETVPVA